MSGPSVFTAVTSLPARLAIIFPPRWPPPYKASCSYSVTGWLFKQSVEIGMMGRIIAADSDLGGDTIERLRARCVQDAKRTNGQISFRDILRIKAPEL